MKKRGISLIVLVVTIIVIVILGTAVIVTFAKNNPIETAKIAVLKGDAKAFSEELTLTFTDEKLNDKEFDPEIINAASVEDMKKYIPSFSEKYYGKLCIVNGKLAYVKGNVTEKEKISLEEVGLVPGSYITEGQINDIDNKTANIPEGATTTDISEYIDGVPAEQAGKFTIYKGKLYYRYEKTTYEERKVLSDEGMLFLAGDVNADGTISNEDAEMISLFECFGFDNMTSDNIYYIGDINGDGYIDSTDAGIIDEVLYGLYTYESIVNSQTQNLDRAHILGLQFKANDFYSLGEQFMKLSKFEESRITVIDEVVAFRYERLTESERAILYEYKVPFNLGDLDFNGILDYKDVEILRGLVAYPNKNTPILEVLANIDGILRPSDKKELINGNDTSKLRDIVNGTKKFRDAIEEYFAKRI